MKIELSASDGESRSHTGVKHAGSSINWAIAATTVSQPDVLAIRASNIVPNALRVYGIDGTTAASVEATGETTLNWPQIEQLAKSPTANTTAVAIARLLLAARTHGVTQ